MGPLVINDFQFLENLITRVVCAQGLRTLIIDRTDMTRVELCDQVREYATPDI